MSYTQRTADYVIQKAFLRFKGKATPPATSSTKYAQLLSTLDDAQKEWASEPGIEWNSLYDKVDNGTVTATDTFDLDDNINYVSKREGDYVTLVSADGTRTQEVPLVAPDQLYASRYSYACAVIGRTLVFSKKFETTSTLLGYTIKVPAIIFCDDITSGSSLIQCDNPLYLADMVAAEVSRLDVTKRNQYQNLLDKAAEKMAKMKEQNGGQYESIPTMSMAMSGESWT